MNSTFWLGLVLGALFGIVLEFLSRPLQRYFDRRLETRAQLRGEELRQERVGNREAVRDFLVLQILETTLIGAITGIVSGVLFGAGNFLPYEDIVVQRILTTAGQVVAVVGAVLIVRIAGDAISIARATQGRKSKKSGSAPTS